MLQSIMLPTSFLSTYLHTPTCKENVVVSLPGGGLAIISEWSRGIHTDKGNYKVGDLLHFKVAGADRCGIAKAFIYATVDPRSGFGAVINCCHPLAGSDAWSLTTVVQLLPLASVLGAISYVRADAASILPAFPISA